MSERFEARVSPVKTGLLVFGSLAFVAIGIWMLTDSGPSRSFRLFHLIEIPASVIAWVCILFFGVVAIGWLRQFARSEPVMEIGRDGISWRRWSDRTIPWAAIERAEVTRMANQPFLALWLSDPVRYGSTTLLGRMQGANKAMGFGDIALSVQGTNRSFDEMVEAVQAHAPGLLRD